MKEKWRTRDWIWVLVILLYAQGFTLLYKEYVMDVISYVSTFVSTALGAVAIYISIREATNNDDVKDEIYIALAEMKTTLNSLDIKMDSINPQQFNQEKNEEIQMATENYSEEIVKLLQSKLSETANPSSAEIIDSINAKMKELAEDLKEKINLEENSQKYQSNLAASITIQNPFMDVLNSFEIGEEFTVDSFHRRMRKIGKVHSKSYIQQRLANFRNEGYVDKKSNIFIRVK